MRRRFALFLLAFAASTAAWAQANYPEPRETSHVLKNFTFHTGQVMPELRMNVLTIGDPKNEPVLVLHGTAGSARSMLSPAWAGEMFGPGQPLDASRYFIVIPDSLGHGKSSKPSDGQRAAFPKYNYEDMVDAQYRLGARGHGHPAPAPDHRQQHGRHAHLDLGHEVPHGHGGAGADGLPA